VSVIYHTLSAGPDVTQPTWFSSMSWARCLS
jgi:hypothetical protein